MRLVAALAVLAGLLLHAEWVLADREAERERFREGWAAASRGDQLNALQAVLDLPDYPLTPYLEYELMRQRIDQVPATVVVAFLARYRDWSFAGNLETRWLRSLGRRSRHEQLLAHGINSRDSEVRCHLGRAMLATGDTAQARELARELWLVGRSQPRACDPLFAWWRRQGNPGPELAWERFVLAIEAGETSLAGYLRRYLADEDRVSAERWLAMHARPTATLRQARSWRDHARNRDIIASGIHRLAASDWERADSYWQPLRSRFDWPPAQQVALDRRIALFRAVALDEAAIVAIDALPAEAVDQQMLEWRTRAALAHDDWPAVIDSIQSMTLGEQASARWRYWRARALAELGRPEAGLVYASLAGEANFHGFLAAARLDQPPSLCSLELSVDPALQRRLLRDAEFERAIELYHVGLLGHGRRTWARASSRYTPAELRQAALLAAGVGWHDRSIAALNASGDRQAYRWRFPLVKRGLVEPESARHGLPPALVYGLMRAESAMQPDALSGAGARGLLQLMPDTAAAVARRNGMSYRGQSELFDGDKNVRLGIAHLAELDRRYGSNWTHVAAAYNAGPGALARWLRERPELETDRWIETLPFFETRDYIPRVLAFATVYEWHLGQPPSLLASSLDLPVNSGTRFECSQP